MKYWLCLLLAVFWVSVRAEVAVLTQHNNLNRTGANLEESTLNVTNVNVTQFGRLYTRLVDDQIYAQPLIMTNVTVPGHGVHNLLIVATVNDSVYAFDADDASVTTPYWQVSFTNANAVPPKNVDMTGACGGDYQDFSGNIGIVGTPVIDPATGTIYLIARTKEYGSVFVQRLHALDVRTGAEQLNSPVTITATYPGNGDGSVDGVLTFDPQKQNQRPALVLTSGVVYIGWASHCDWGPYHGWFIGYDATNLAQVVVYNTTPNGEDGGIWMSGAAPAVDEAGNIYLTVGNGTVGDDNSPTNIINRGESFLKLARSGTNLNVLSWFTPWDWVDLEAHDQDLGSCGIMLIPGTTLAISGSKEGNLYLVNRDQMGGLSFDYIDDNIVQWFLVTDPNKAVYNIHGGPVWWQGPAGSYLYIWGEADYLRQYQFDTTNSVFLLPNLAQSPAPAPMGMPGGILSVTANGTNSGSGIVWATHQYTGDANQEVRPGILHAYDASDVSRELWNSEQNSARDSVGKFAKFVPPTVANGKVYLATFSGRVNVYGLLPTLNLAWEVNAGQALLSWSTNNAATFTLQASPDPLDNTWQDVCDVPGVTNGQYQLPLLVTNQAMFYRLKGN